MPSAAATGRRSPGTLPSSSRFCVTAGAVSSRAATPSRSPGTVSVARCPWGWTACSSGASTIGSTGERRPLSALLAVVDPPQRGRGPEPGGHPGHGDADTAPRLRALVAPVRPTLKHRYPLTPMERYVRWRRPDRAPFDPWLRVHRELGARVLGVARRSMVVQGSVVQWEQWTGMRFPASGRYVVSGPWRPSRSTSAAIVVATWSRTSGCCTRCEGAPDPFLDPAARPDQRPRAPASRLRKRDDVQDVGLRAHAQSGGEGGG
jgi:hypothetical protein